MADDGGRPVHLWPGATAPVSLTMNPAGARAFPPHPAPLDPEAARHAPGTHVCTIHPPGLPRAFDVPFPERRLPVCDRCKKNFKSRDLCRKRDGHKALPWQATYVAVTLAGSALATGPNGELCHADVTVAARLQDTPLMCLGPADGSMRSEPICKVCREKNYTRDHCRNASGHTTPPWNTTYVTLQAAAPPSDHDRYKYPKKRKKHPEEGADGKPRPDPAGPDGEAQPGADAVLADIHKSRTFLMKVSSKRITVRWCERIQYPEAVEPEETSSHPSFSHHPGALPPPPGGAPGFPSHGALQHNTQLWDAFRAGALWAQSQGAYGYAPYAGPPPGSFFAPPGGLPPGSLPPGGGPMGALPPPEAPGGRDAEEEEGGGAGSPHLSQHDI